MATKFSQRSTRPMISKPSSKTARKGGKSSGSGPLLIGAGIAAGLFFLLTRESKAAQTPPATKPAAGTGPKPPTDTTKTTTSDTKTTTSDTKTTTDTKPPTDTGKTEPPVVKPKLPEPGDLFADPSIKNPQAGVASSPDVQWKYMVKAGDVGPAALASKIMGNAYDYVNKATFYSYLAQLIEYNKPKPYIGNLNNASGIEWKEGDTRPRMDWNGTPNPAGKYVVPKLNFKTYTAGEIILIPKAWNKFIDQKGNTTGSQVGWPTA